MRSDSLSDVHAIVSCGRLPRHLHHLLLSAATATLLVAVALAGPPAVQAQTADGSVLEQLAQLRAEVQRMREELAALKQEHSREGAAIRTEENLAPAADVAMLKAQVEEQAQTKVESSSRFPVKIFGKIVSSTYLNTGEANWPDHPNLVSPSSPARGPSGSLSSTLRQSRLGLAMEGPSVGTFRTSGVMAFDFFGGAPGFQTGPVMALPRLLYAFARMETDTVAFEAGQDQIILAPRNPTSLAADAFPDLYRSGNLYLRAPQLRVERALARRQASSLWLTAGILAPLAGDFESVYTFAPPALSGERSQLPAFETRLAWRSGDPASDSEHIEIAASGHYAQAKTNTDTRTSWAASVDFDLQQGRLGAAGEFFAGRNLQPFGGAVAQAGPAAGGWFEGRVGLTRRVDVAAGFGFDRPDVNQRPRPVLSLNRSLFGNAIYRFSPELAASFEYRWLSTSQFSGGDRRNHHLNWIFAYSF